MGNPLARAIEADAPSSGGVCLWWLAQAGFVFKSGKGRILYLDAYLSDVVEKAFGFKRLMPSPIPAEAVRADWVVSSHEHLDHLDTDALPAIMKNCPTAKFAGSLSCLPEYAKMGIDPGRILCLEPGGAYELEDVKLTCARADHGDLSPHALSMLFDFGDVRILFTGDTAWNLPLIQPLIDLKPDLLIPCINGRFGNLNPEEAAELARLCGARAVIPCHFWMFKEHNGDPEAFVRACQRICPEVEVRLLAPGEGLSCSKDTMESLKTNKEA